MAFKLAQKTSASALFPKNTSFWLCDVQERFSSVIKHWPSVTHVANTMLDFSEKLDIPVIATEQYPKAFGRLVDDLHGIPAATGSDNAVRYDETKRIAVFEKTKFSMLTSPHFQSLIDEAAVEDVPPAVVLFGIEAHVCVQQTALELLSLGCKVHVVSDGTSSQNDSDRLAAFERMRQSGAFISTYESILFHLLGDAKHPSFKAVQPLFKESRPENGLLIRTATSDNLLQAE